MYTAGLKLLVNAIVGVATMAIATAPAVAGTPRSVSGHNAAVVSTDVTTPTSFAFDGRTVFEGDGGNETTKVGGGVFVLKGGRPHRLPGSPAFVGGLAWSKGSLYLSATNPTSRYQGISTIQKWSGWNGTTFRSRQTIYTAPQYFQGFNGLAIGPDGRLYVGADVGLLTFNDHGPASLSPYLYDILSMTTSGTGFRVYARGIRQPWQMVFPAGWRYPLVSDLGQDFDPANPLDLVLRVTPGQDYGFPGCPAVCSGRPRPWTTFPAHTDVMGLAIIGKTLYMASYLGVGARGPGEILSKPLAGHGKARKAVTGFYGAVIALGANGKTLYVGQPGQKAGEGIIYSVKP